MTNEELLAIAKETCIEEYLTKGIDIRQTLKVRFVEVGSDGNNIFLIEFDLPKKVGKKLELFWALTKINLDRVTNLQLSMIRPTELTKDSVIEFMAKNFNYSLTYNDIESITSYQNYITVYISSNSARYSGSFNLYLKEDNTDGNN